MAESGAGGRGKPAAEEGLSELRADLATLREEMATVLAAVKQLGDTAVRTAKRQQGIAIGQLTTEASALADEAVSAGRDQIAVLEAKIRGQPLAAVGIAFFVGLVFGSLRR
ncbi:MAG: hypothetical protein AB7I59_15070 [Geminicoccaceae bacterium]